MSGDLQAFYADLQNTVRAAAASDGTFTQSAFVDEISKRMSAVEEIDALIPCHFEGPGVKNKTGMTSETKVAMLSWLSRATTRATK